MAQFDRAIPPGGEGKITLKVNLKGYQGSVKKTATVFTNDPQNAKTMLVLQGNVRSVIDVRPSGNISFRGMAEQVTEKTVDVVGTSQPFKIEKVESNLQDKVRYEVETVEDGKHYRVKVNNLVKQGNYNGYIKLLTNVPEKSELMIRVGGFIEGEVTVKPLTVLVGKMAAQQPVRVGKVMVVSNRNKPFTIKKLTYDEKLLAVKQEPLPKEPGFSLEISPRMENLAAGSRQQSTLTIETDAGSDEPLKVQVHILNTPDAPNAPPSS